MIYEGKPSKNQMISTREMGEMVREQQEEYFKQERVKAFREETSALRDMNEQARRTRDYFHNQEMRAKNRREFLGKVKSAFLCESIMKLFRESVRFNPNQRDINVMKGLVEQFVSEQGAAELIERFSDANTTLAEMSRIVKENYGHVLEGLVDIRTCDTSSIEDYTKSRPKQDESKLPGRAMELKLQQDDVDNFYRDLNGLDVAEASKLIKDRVADGVNTFIDQNISNKADYTEVINQAKEHISDTTSEAAIMETMNRAKRIVNTARKFAKRNVFQTLVEAVTKEALSNEDMNKHYVHESQVDMRGITHSAEIIYTFIEMVNTTEMVDTDYIKAYIESMAGVTA